MGNYTRCKERRFNGRGWTVLVICEILVRKRFTSSNEVEGSGGYIYTKLIR